MTPILDLILKLRGTPPQLQVNPSNGFLKLWGCFARTGVQVYSNTEMGLEGDGVVGVYRDSAFIEQLAEALSDAPFVEDHQRVFLSRENKPIGYVSSTSVESIDSECWVTGEVTIYDTDVAEELLSYYQEHGHLFIPVSPSYQPITVEKDGTWEDTLGLLGAEGDTIKYQYCQEGPVTSNHLAGVVFGRGGDTAGLFAIKVTDDSTTLYPYPQTSLNKKQKRSKNKMTKMTQKSPPKPAESPAVDSAGADQSPMKILADQQSRMADAMEKMADLMGQYSKDVTKTCDGLECIAKTNDAILGSLESLSTAINRAFESSEAPASRENASANNEKTMSQGQQRGFLHAGAIDSLKADLKSVVDLHKALTDAIGVIAPTPTDEVLPSVDQRSASKTPTPGRSSVQTTDSGFVVL